MEDNKIIQLYWNRDTDAIEITKQKYGRYCTAIAQNILNNNEDAEECLNDTYLKAWNSMPKIWPKQLSVYLGTITRNLSFNRYKKKYANKRGSGEIALVLDELAECVSGKELVERQIEEKELITYINSFINLLPREKRTIFVCRYWYSDSIAQIAQENNMSIGSVTMILKRTREKLKEYLINKGVEL